MTVELTRAAERDIEHILERSITDFGPDQAERYAESLSRCLDRLGENPSLGAGVEGIGQGYRRFPHQSHVVFYRVTNRGVRVIRILHRRMDAHRALRGRP